MLYYPNRGMLLKFAFDNFLNKHKVSDQIRGHLTVFKYLTCRNNFPAWISKYWGNRAISTALRNPPKISQRVGSAL